MKRATVLTTIFIVVLFFSCKKLEQENFSPAQKSAKAISSENRDNKVKDGEVYVRFKNGYNASVISAAGARMEKHIRLKGMKSDNPGYYKLNVPKGQERKIADELSKNSNVAWATVANVVETFQTQPNDPMWNPPVTSLWGITNMGADQVWASGNHGDSTLVTAVIDEGVFPHEDLCPNIYINPYEIPNNGIDDDGNGYIDDRSGWDFMHNDNQVYDGVDVHATGVSSAFAALTNNQLGMPSINWNVKILSLKFLEGSGSDFDAINAFYYAIDFKERHHIKLKTINCSWGGGGFNPALVEAMQACRDADILINCAAGNWAADNDVQPTYPSNYSLVSDNIISVGASTSTNDAAPFSCFGKTSVNIFAPGSNIRVCWVTNSTSSYRDVGGTSLATPYVTGAENAYFALHPNDTYLQCKTAILSNAIPTPALANLCSTGGRLNINTPAFKGNSLGLNQSYGGCGIQFIADIDAPQIHGDPVLTEQGFGWIRLTCPPATDTLNNSIGHYNSGVKEYDWIFDENFSAENISSGPTIQIGITNGPHTCRYRVLDNWSHPSAWSNAVPVQAIIDTTPPSTPEPLAAFPSNLDSIVCIWHQSFDNSTIPPDYRIYYRIIGTPTWHVRNFGSGFLSGTLPDLSGGLYELYSTSVDFVGNESAPPLNPDGTPKYTFVELLGNEGGGDTLPPQDTQPPTINQLFRVDSTLNSITVGWPASTDNVGVVGYHLYWRKQGTFTFNSVTTAALQYTVPNLDSSSVYEFKHEAFDAAANISSQSSLLAVHTLSPIPPPPQGDEVPPTNPTNLNATATNWQQIKLNWTASTDNVAVAYYIVYRDGVQVGTTTATTYTDNGLAQSTTYTYTVKAVDTSNNQSGDSNIASATTKKKGKKN